MEDLNQSLRKSLLTMDKGLLLQSNNQILAWRHLSRDFIVPSGRFFPFLARMAVDGDSVRPDVYRRSSNDGKESRTTAKASECQRKGKRTEECRARERITFHNCLCGGRIELAF